MKLLRIFALPLIVVLLFLTLQLRRDSHHFYEEPFNMQNVLADVERLSSAEYQGRLIGSPGNEAALNYLETRFADMGLKPVEGADGYRQEFTTAITDIDDNALFSVPAPRADDEKINFQLYSDYSLYSIGWGGDFSGDILLIRDRDSIFDFDTGDLSGRMLVIATAFIDDRVIARAADAGAKGIFFTAPGHIYGSEIEQAASLRPVEFSYRVPDRLLLGALSTQAYIRLRGLISENVTSSTDSGNSLSILSGVRISVDQRSPVVNSANLLGVLPGRGEGSLIISAAMDSRGTGPGNTYFPGAGSTAAPTALLLEIARTLSLQKNRPGPTLIFTLWNGEPADSAGAGYYARNPLLPLDKTALIHLGGLGAADSRLLRLSSDNLVGSVLRSKLRKLGSDVGVPALEADVSGSSAIMPFINRKIPSVMISTSGTLINNYSDSVESLESDEISRAGALILNYVKRDLYADTPIDYLPIGATTAFAVLIVVLLCIQMISAAYRSFPSGRLWGISMERLYFSRIISLTRKFFYYFLPFALALFLFIVIINMPSDGRVLRINGLSFTNYSMYLVLKHSLETLSAFLKGSASSTVLRGSLSQVIFRSALNSGSLIVSALIISILAGIITGMGESLGRKHVRGLSPAIITASIPDVVIVLAATGLYIYLNRDFPAAMAVIRPGKFLLPLLAASVLPATFASRISSVFIREEMLSPHILFARSLGYSEPRIFRDELLPPLLSRIFDSFPMLVSMMLTNLIIVEYLMDFKGMVYYLLYFYSNRDISSFIATALSLAGLFMILSFLGKIGSLAVNPSKRRRRA